MKTLRVLWVWCLLVCAALLLTSCLRLERTITVDRDGGMRVENAFDVEIARAIPVMRDALLDVDYPDDPEAFLCERVSQSGQALGLADSSAKSFNDDGFCGVRISEGFARTADMSALLSFVMDTGSGGSTLTNDGEVWDFTSGFSTRLLVEGSGTGRPSANRQLRDQATIVFRLELPGRAIDGRHNADEVDGGTFVWNVDPTDQAPFMFAATSTAGIPVENSGVPLGILIGSGVFVLASLGLGGWVLRSRRASKAPADSMMGVVGPDPAEPIFDEVRGVWTMNDPERGPLWFHEAANDWVPF